VGRHSSNPMPDDRREDCIREIDRRVAELDALLEKFRNNVSGRKDPNVLSADGGWPTLHSCLHYHDEGAPSFAFVRKVGTTDRAARNHSKSKLKSRAD